MAFRIEAAAFAILMALPAGAAEYSVRHRHLREGAVGVLRIDERAIVFEEAGKHKEHSRTWMFDDIRQLTLAPDEVRVETYEGRNRVFVFDRAPKALAAEWYPVFRAKLDQRFVAALADERAPVDWRIPVKLVRLRHPVQGELSIGREGVVFRTEAVDESRSWRIADIEAVASAGRFELVITTREKEFRFELKQALPAARYQELWRSVNRAQGLEVLNGDSHE